MFDTSISLEKIQNFGRGCMFEHVGIRVIEIGKDYLKATMPVDHRTTQPFGILHGGASVVLAETLGSMASQMLIDAEKQICVGVEINANHIRSVPSGKTVTGTARPIHTGRRMHVWQIDIENEEGKLVCTSRLTVSILDK